MCLIFKATLSALASPNGRPCSLNEHTRAPIGPFRLHAQTPCLSTCTGQHWESSCRLLHKTWRCSTPTNQEGAGNKRGLVATLSNFGIYLGCRKMLRGRVVAATAAHSKKFSKFSSPPSLSRYWSWVLGKDSGFGKGGARVLGSGLTLFGDFPLLISGKLSLGWKGLAILGQRNPKVYIFYIKSKLHFKGHFSIEYTKLCIKSIVTVNNNIEYYITANIIQSRYFIKRTRYSNYYLLNYGKRLLFINNEINVSFSVLHYELNSRTV